MNWRTGSKWAVLLALFAARTVMAGPFVWAADPSDDATGGGPFEAYAIGYSFDSGLLDVVIRTNYPESGLYGNDSYATDTLFTPGDLYINVGGSHNAGTGSVFGIGMTDHVGMISADPSETLGWPVVYQGHIYEDAVFSTGTFEGYPHAGPVTGTPYDGGDDPAGHHNNYPALIGNYGSDLGDLAQVSWNSVGGQDWDYEVVAHFDTADIGLTEGTSFEFWWTMECGNDAVKIAGAAPPVPEPASLALLSLGLVGLVRRRRA